MSEPVHTNSGRARKQTDNRRNVVIYRDLLLPPSENFIWSQTEALQTFRPFYLGSRSVEGIPLPDDRTVRVNGGGWVGLVQEILFKQTGWAPRAFEKIASLDPVLLHAHFDPGGVWSLPFATKLHLPLVVTYHGFDATMSDAAIKREMRTGAIYIKRRERLKSQTNLFIAVSDFIKGEMVRKGFPEEKIVVHYIGVDTTQFVARPEIQREPIVLFVGRLVENKGCRYLIKAMETVQHRFPSTELVIIGDGPQRQELEKAARSTLARFRFLGFCSPLEVKQWMNRAQVFSVPSNTVSSGASEGLGMVFLEAQAMGLPVVPFATGGIPEAVAHGTTGFLAAEKDWQALAIYITQLLEDEELWESMSKAGRKRIESRFHLGTQTELLEEIYNSLIE